MSPELRAMFIVHISLENISQHCADRVPPDLVSFLCPLSYLLASWSHAVDSHQYDFHLWPLGISWESYGPQLEKVGLETGQESKELVFCYEFIPRLPKLRSTEMAEEKRPYVLKGLEKKIT